jgi:hypothetical protein
MDCHLGWYFTIGSSLRGGRGEKKIQKNGFSAQKKIKEKNVIHSQHFILHNCSHPRRVQE